MAQFEELLADIDRQRRRRLVLTVVPIAAAVVFLLVTIHQIAEARRELLSVEREIAAKKQQLDFLGKALWNAGPERSREAIAKAVDAEPALAQVAGRVYLHIRAEEQRPQAREIGQRLRAMGYIVPGIERLDQGPPRSQVRYFKKADEPEARRLAAAVGQAEAAYIEGHEESTQIRARHFEIWLAP